MTAPRHELPTFEDLREELAGTTPTSQQLLAHFRPTFDVIAETTPQREQDRELAYRAIELLRDAGLTRVHLSWEQGGLNGSITQLIELFIALGTADSNLPQALHSHYLFTQILANQPQGPITDWVLDETAAGKIFANAIVELPPATGYRTTTVGGPDAQDGSSAVINGDKFYTTGALFADYLMVAANNPADDSKRLFAVASDHPGVQRVDDWNGFGQRLTASGSTFFNDVPADHERSMTVATPSGVLGYPFVWLMLASAQVGSGFAALRDITAYVQSRRRTYGHATAETPAQDPLVQQVVGDVSAKIHSASYIALGAAGEVQAAFDAVKIEDDLSSQTFIDAHTAANVAVSHATITISNLIIDATSQIFEVGGASAVDADKQLHRHWLNARVIGSQAPLIYRSRMVGDHVLNGVTPPLNTSVRDSAPSKPDATVTSNAGQQPTWSTTTGAAS